MRHILELLNKLKKGMIDIAGTLNVDQMHAVQKASKRISFNMSLENKEIGKNLKYQSLRKFTNQNHLLTLK